MRSTGEALGLSEDWGRAFFKAQEGTKTELPTEGTVLISVNDRDKPELVEIAQKFHNDGFNILATGRTYDMIIDAGIPAKRINKIFEGRPDIVDAITNGEIDLIVDTPTDKKGDPSDSYIRKNAIKHHVPYITTMAAARASAEGIGAEKLGEGTPVRSLQEYHASIG